jgi:hypothetical protein
VSSSLRVFPALCRLRQEFEVYLNYVVRFCLKTKTNEREGWREGEKERERERERERDHSLHIKWIKNKITNKCPIILPKFSDSFKVQSGNLILDQFIKSLISYHF